MENLEKSIEKESTAASNYSSTSLANKNKDSRNKAQDKIRCQLLSEFTDAYIIPSEKNENTQSRPFPSEFQKKMEDLIGPSELNNKELETDKSSILLKIINQLKPCKTSCQSLVQPEPSEAKTVEKRPSKRDNILCNMFEEPKTLIKSRRYISSKEDAQFPVLDDGDFM
ncbi:hypothetical protein C0Q70_05976 [Pomacea canaliculata]|uniref:Uncharacterized protein n=1 Tax=Pomacea canaliculata TaxID=400727 RepID=A0A2T7PMQ9_POMCA|nr:hypothetical protein C0Q70_05976 [Pomacea canaliculata]